MPYKICNFMNAEKNLLTCRQNQSILTTANWTTLKMTAQPVRNSNTNVQLYSRFHDYDRMVQKM